MAVLVEAEVLCYHCGQPCPDVSIGNVSFEKEGKVFCCPGCKTAFEIINENQLCQYYNFETHPGLKTETGVTERYLYLEEETIRKQLIEFDSSDFCRIRFTIPSIHCVSCIWLLENLHKADPGIIRTEVNFTGKSVLIDFDSGKIKLSRLASLLAAIGYPPQINPDSAIQKRPADSSLVAKLALAGFCFGNVMLFSFPEYLGLSENEITFRHLFSWLSVALSIPVLLYSAKDYFISAWKSFAQRQINIDFPIAAGLLALFTRSTWDIVTYTGPGYLDSFTGLVFFLLIGRWFQSKTYETLAFDRDYRSYFPLAVQRLVQSQWKAVVIHQLKKGDLVKVRNREIVPADCILQDKEVLVDYSFVTGEERPVRVKEDEIVYAGGRVLGQPVVMQIEKETSQSYLTSLWNHDLFRKPEVSRYKRIIDNAARKFIWIVLGLAGVTGVYWYLVDPSQTWLILTSVLMVACPCALALAAPFTYGSMLRNFGRQELYLKNAEVIERLATIDAVVFDKTGTVTYGKDPEITFHGDLSSEEIALVKLLTSYSTHPLSSMISKSLTGTAEIDFESFVEKRGRGIEGRTAAHHYRIGSAVFTDNPTTDTPSDTCVFVSIDSKVRGFFSIKVSVRIGVHKMLKRLGPKCVALLSGDGEADRARMKELFGPKVELRFNQNPHDKMEFIRSLQQQGKRVLMVGDGLNDAGALKQSDVGLAVTDDTAIFTPACDGILKGDQIVFLDKFLTLSKSSTTVLKTAFAISFLYNAIALSFAVTGHLTPLVAAILMPLSSMTVVAVSTGGIKWITRNIDSKKQKYNGKVYHR